MAYSSYPSHMFETFDSIDFSPYPAAIGLNGRVAYLKFNQRYDIGMINTELIKAGMRQSYADAIELYIPSGTTLAVEGYKYGTMIKDQYLGKRTVGLRTITAFFEHPLLTWINSHPPPPLPSS